MPDLTIEKPLTFKFKFKLDLRDKVDGSKITIQVKLYDDSNGLMQFPVDLNQWEVLNITQIK